MLGSQVLWCTDCERIHPSQGAFFARSLRSLGLSEGEASRAIGRSSTWDSCWSITREVRDIYERLKAAGVAMKLELGIQGPAFFQCIGPDGISVEVRAPKDN
jgi:hypothetical protein